MEHHEPQDNKAHEEEKNCNKEDTMLQSKEAKKPSLFRRSSINSGRPNFSHDPDTPEEIHSDKSDGDTDTVSEI